MVQPLVMAMFGLGAPERLARFLQRVDAAQADILELTLVEGRQLIALPFSVAPQLREPPKLPQSDPERRRHRRTVETRR